MGKLISVIVPVYNSENFLEDCLESLINQTYKNLEIIIINDGSTDNSFEICKKYSMIDYRIKIINQPNSGVSNARNSGLKIAAGDYISFIDSDDYLELNTYEYLLAEVSHHSVDVVTYEYFVTRINGEVINIQNDSFYGLKSKDDFFQKIVNGGNKFLWSILFSKEVIGSIRFNEKVARGEDTLFVFETMYNAERIYCLKTPLYHYVQSEESASRGSFRANQLSVIEYSKLSISFFEKKFPALLTLQSGIISELLIGIYTDMYFDENEWKKERKMIYKKFEQYFGVWWFSNDTKLKRKIKTLIFLISPTLFCEFHSILHKR